MDKNILKYFAERDGIIPRSARFARERLNVGENIGGHWFITESEWNQIKNNMRGKGQYERKKK